MASRLKSLGHNVLATTFASSLSASLPKMAILHGL